jgi:hypothetical protein
MKKITFLFTVLFACSLLGQITWPPSGSGTATGLKTATTTVSIGNATAPTAGQVLQASSGTAASWATISGTGTVTSIAWADGSTTPLFSISGSPVTGAGTITATLITRSANTVFAGPSSGSAAQPTFRSLVSADIPSLSGTYLVKSNNLSDVSSASSSFLNISPLSNAGDIIYENSTPAPARLAIGTNGQVLTVSGGLPAWAAAAGGGISALTNDITASGSGSVAATVAAIQGTTVSGTSGTGKVLFQTSPVLITPALGTPASGIMTNVTGTASGLTAGTVTTNANLTGPITSSGNVTSVGAQTGIGSTFVMNTSPSLITPNLGTPSALVGTNISGTAASLTAGNATAANALNSATTAVSTLGATAPTAGQILTASNSTTASWVTPTFGSGTVTSVAATVPSIFSISGTPITTSGTFGITYSGTPLPLANGGTASTTASTAFNTLSPLTTTGDIIYSSSGTTNSRLGIGSTGNVLTVAGGVPTWAAPISGGVTSVAMTVPTFLSVSGSPITTTGTFGVTLSGTALPSANGGTGVTSVTTSPTASSFAGWDSNSNLSANNFIPASASHGMSGGTTTLTVTSPQNQIFTGGTSSQSVVLPNTSTLVVGFTFNIQVATTTNGSAVLTVKASDGSTITSLAVNANFPFGIFTCISTSTSTSTSWSYSTPVIGPSGGSSTNSIATFADGTGTGLKNAGFTISTTPANSTVSAWDSNKNLSANAFLPASSNYSGTSTLTLTSASAQIQTFTANTGAIVVNLPQTSTLALGTSYTLVSLGGSAGSGPSPITVKTNSGATIYTYTNLSSITVPPITFTCISTSVNDTNGWTVSAPVSAESYSQSKVVTWGTSHNSFTSSGFGISTNPGASTAAVWDTNSYLSANTFITGFTTVSTSGGTTSLVAGNNGNYAFTGSSNQTVVMPSAGGLLTGTPFEIRNYSTGTVTVESSNAATIQVMAANTILHLYNNTNTGTTPTSWNIAYGPINGGSIGQIPGTTTNDSASSGNVGEYQSANPGSTVSPGASGAWATITSKSLTAGDWDVWCTGDFTPGTVSLLTSIAVGISLTTNAIDVTNVGNLQQLNASLTGVDYYLNSGIRRVSLASTSTVYCVGNIGYTTVGTAVWGTDSTLQARRIR